MEASNENNGDLISETFYGPVRTVLRALHSHNTSNNVMKQKLLLPSPFYSRKLKHKEVISTYQKEN